LKKPIHFLDVMDADHLARQVASNWDSWHQARNQWHNQTVELRNFLFATDTTTTSNSSLPWKNKTTLPKLTQIRDNLHANYMAALFPTSDWLDWQGDNSDSQNSAKRKAIIAFMRNKLEQAKFENVVSRLVLDYIDTGNAFARADYRNETHTDPDGNVYSVFRGPVLSRTSSYDIVFNPTAANFEDTPTITRSLISYGTLADMVANGGPDVAWSEGLLERIKKVRYREFYNNPEVLKAVGFRMDGFSDFSTYLQSGMIEILEYEGDIFDEETGEFYHNHRIVVADRSFVALNEPSKSWFGKKKTRHAGWRLRPDNLWAMGPLDNLVGMQYRLDHLENLKADVFDQIANPVVFERGFVNDWKWGPGEKIQGDEASDVRTLSPDATALNADFQIQNLMAQMEELAGAPKQAMGIRTPGEKTAYEVQALENAAGRIFQTKIRQFEKNFLEPLLNEMFETARRNMDVTETVRVEDQDLGVVEFLELTRDDLTAKGRLVPKGARHFAERANAIQTLNMFTSSAVYQDPTVQVHISGLEIARIFDELLDFKTDNLVRPYVRIAEQAEAMKNQQAAQAGVMEDAAMIPELEEGEPSA
jgi:hypothetical protein